MKEISMVVEDEEIEDEFTDENSENNYPKNQSQVNNNNSTRIRFGILFEVTDGSIVYNSNNDLSQRDEDDLLEDIEGCNVEYEYPEKENLELYIENGGKLFESESITYDDNFEIYEEDF
jgi:5-enolpyruvylshikimate-3-phosphate synthase